jgi:hypothetical protein
MNICSAASWGWDAVSVEFNQWFNWLFLALTILAALILFLICAAFYVVYVIDRFFNWLDRRLFLALAILVFLILLSIWGLRSSTYGG